MNEIAWSSSPNDEWNLIHLRLLELRSIYCDREYWGEFALSPESLRKRRQKHRRLTSKGVRQMPRRTEEYRGPDEERDRVRERRQKQAPKVGEAAIRFSLSEIDRQRLHQQLDELLDNYELDPATVDRLGIKKVTTWQMGYKDSEGEAQTHPLYGIQLEADPKEFKPKWDIEISKLEYKLRLSKAERKERLDGFKSAVVFGDPHFAFRRFPDGSMDPIHDPKALELTLAIINDVRPEHVISAGDMLDYAELSRFEKQPEFQGTMNATLRAAGAFLKSIKEMVPDAEFDILEGNHCRRLHKSIVTNFSDAYGWKVGGDEDLDPALSVPSLMNYEQLGINYIAGYPANRLSLNRELQIKHGNLVKSRDSTAKAVTGDERISTIYGHIHRIEQHGRTMQTPDGPRRIHAFSAGCLCRIDGAVPSTHSSTDIQGRPLENYENWEQGILIVHYHEDGRYFVEPVPFDLNHKAMYRGKLYEA